MAEDSNVDRRLVASSRGPGHNWDVYEPSNAKVEYADGFGPLLFGPQVSRIQLFTMKRMRAPEDASQEHIEEREISLLITVPTTQLLEMIVNTVTSMVQGRDQIMHGLDAARQNVEHLLSQVTVDAASKS